MNILFCSEGFIIDGVASYNLYLSAALRRAGNQVAIIGRWAGFRGFQKRYRENKVQVIQMLSISLVNSWFIREAAKFHPDILITDSRRSFPLARRIHGETDAKIITIFHDPPQLDRTDHRSIDKIAEASHAWVTSEKPIYEELKKIEADLPIYWIQRPIAGMVHPTSLPLKDPFHVVCLGRLSRWKSPGIRTIVEKAADMKRSIPSLKITVVGGGRRRVGFLMDAAKANQEMKERFVRVVGAQTDPRQWLQQATVVCAGATAAIEAILSGRPVMALSGFWMGPVTMENLDQGVATHFGERAGAFYVRDDPDVVINSLIDLYHNWDQEKMVRTTTILRKRLAPEFDSQMVAKKFGELFEQLDKK